MKDRYEFIKETSKKFWEVQVKDDMLLVRFGRIGTEGKVHIKNFPSQDKAFDARTKLILEKERKGYVLVSSELVVSDHPDLSAPNTAICNMYVGEHVWEEAKGLCKWLTQCLKEKMSPPDFAKLWNKFQEEGECRGVPGSAEDFEMGEDDLDRIYLEAFKQGADRFIVFDNNAYVDIIAVCGVPTGKEIALLVFEPEKNVGKWTDQNTIEALGNEYFWKELEKRKE